MGTPPAQAQREQSRLVATYSTFVVDYLTDEAGWPVYSTTSACSCTAHRCAPREYLLIT
jgi:hypothetical protein